MKKIIYVLLFITISSFSQDIELKTLKSEVFKDEYKESQIVLSEEDGNGGILIVRSYNGKGIFANRGFYFERYDGNLNMLKEFDFQIEHPSSHKYATALGVVKTETVIRIIEMYYDINEKSYICVANSIHKNDFKLERTMLFKLTRDELKQYGSFSLSDICYDKNDKKLTNENSFSIAIDFMSNNSTEALKLLLFDNQLTKKIDRIFIKKVADRKYIYQNIDLSKDGNYFS